MVARVLSVWVAVVLWAQRGVMVELGATAHGGAGHVKCLGQHQSQTRTSGTPWSPNGEQMRWRRREVSRSPGRMPEDQGKGWASGARLSLLLSLPPFASPIPTSRVTAAAQGGQGRTPAARVARYVAVGTPQRGSSAI